jgi:hypothetical protein
LLLDICIELKIVDVQMANVTKQDRILLVPIMAALPNEDVRDGMERKGGAMKI